MDNPYDTEAKVFPYLMLKLDNVTRDKVKDSFMNKIKFKIDVFSEYDGEQEILNIEQNIFDAMSSLYDLKYVTYIQESSFRIIDDKSLGPIYKHGVIIYTIYATGIEQEVENETNPTN